MDIDWQRSSFCSGGTCFEVAWVKSSCCHADTCVEVADGDGVILVRDGKHPDLAPLAFSRDAWDAFLETIQAGELTF